MKLEQKEWHEFALKHTGLVKLFARRAALRYPWISLEDFESHAWIGLLISMEKYDPDRNVAFTTYAYKCMFGYVRRAIRESDWLKPHERVAFGDGEFITIRDPLTLECGVRDNPRKIELKDLIEKAIKKFPRRSQEMFRTYFYEGNHTLRSLGEKYRISNQRISQILKPMLAKCEELAKE